jgi:hypothetical protein
MAIPRRVEPGLKSCQMMVRDVLVADDDQPARPDRVLNQGARTAEQTGADQDLVAAAGQIDGKLFGHDAALPNSAGRSTMPDGPAHFARAVSNFCTVRSTGPAMLSMVMSASA